MVIWSINDTGSIDNGTKKKSFRPIWDLPLPKEGSETILSRACEATETAILARGICGFLSCRVLFWTFTFPGCAKDISPWDMADRCSRVSS